MSSSSILAGCLVLFIGLPFALAASSTSSGLRYIEGTRPVGMSAAVVVEDQALAHTSQVFASGPKGEPPSGAAEAQVERTLDNLAAALGAAGSGFDRIVKINVYVVQTVVTDLVEKALVRRFSGAARPAVTLMEGKLPIAGALVAMDAIAAAPAAGAEVVRRTVRGFRSAEGERHVAILPAGPAVFISGYAEPGDPQKAARATMSRLGTALELLDLQKSDVVQVKAFVATATDPEVVRNEIRRFFGDRDVPPLVLLEWRTTGRAVEIELSAAARRRTKEQAPMAIEYITPPGETANPYFTRLVRVNRGRLIFTAGLFGRTEREAEAQIRDIYSQLRDILQQAGSSFDQMVKATYYVADSSASTLLNPIRRELYPPQRPPAASKINVAGTGRKEKTITLDMIAGAP